MGERLRMLIGAGKNGHATVAIKLLNRKKYCVAFKILSVLHITDPNLPKVWHCTNEFPDQRYEALRHGKNNFWRVWSNFWQRSITFCVFHNDHILYQKMNKFFTMPFLFCFGMVRLIRQRLIHFIKLSKLSN